MKMYEKSSLSLFDGLLVAADGTVVAPDSKVIDQANEHETAQCSTGSLAVRL